jgi:hypothetical protein
MTSNWILVNDQLALIGSRGWLAQPGLTHALQHIANVAIIAPSAVCAIEIASFVF